VFRLIKKIVTYLLVLAAAIALVATGYLYFNQDRMIFPAPAGDGPAILNDGLEIVSIKTSDGETITGLYHPPEAEETTVLVFHGNGGSLSSIRSNGVALAKAGFGVLLVEYRGYPGSTGSPTEAGLLLDGLAGYDFVTERSAGPIAIYARSLGTGVGIYVATQRSVLAVFLVAPFDSVLAVAQSRYPFLPLRPLLRHPFESDRRIGAVEAPIFITHGDQDRIIPLAHGQRLLKFAAEGTRFEIVKGGDHGLRSHGTVEKPAEFFKSIAEQTAQN